MLRKKKAFEPLSCGLVGLAAMVVNQWSQPASSVPAAHLCQELSVTDRPDRTRVHLRLAPIHILVVRSLRHPGQTVKQVCHQTLPVLLGKFISLSLDVSQLNHGAGILKLRRLPVRSGQGTRESWPSRYPAVSASPPDVA